MRSIGLISLGAILISSCGPEAGPEASPEMKPIELDVSTLTTVEVGVVTPSDRLIWTRAASFTCRGTSVVEGILSIDPSVAVGYYWDADGQKQEVTVFSETGVHKVLVANNLETEAENSALVTASYDVREAVKQTVDPGGCEPSG